MKIRQSGHMTMVKERRLTPALVVLLAPALCACSVRFDGGGDGDGTIVCGNGNIDLGEECDRDNLAERTCAESGFEGGSLSCRSDCTLDYSGCENGCGNGILDDGEECDDGPENSGTVPDTCRRDCRLPHCGDNVADTTEICDGPDLKGQSCASLAVGTGNLGCMPDCTAFDVRGCSEATWCGNNLLEATEICDSSDLAGQTCESLGYLRGTLLCAMDCSGFDTDRCIRADGEPCTSDDHCDSGYCLDEDGSGYPGGHCARDCASPDDCTGETTCLPVSPNSSTYRCVRPCVDSSVCRPGYACFGPPPYCRPHCEGDTQCATTDGCNEYSGRCEPLGSDGLNGEHCSEPCACEGNLVLISANGTDGYCLSYCSTYTGYCPDNGICTSYFSGDIGDLGVCFQGCVDNADCASGFTCQVWGTLQLCL